MSAVHRIAVRNPLCFGAPTVAVGKTFEDKNELRSALWAAKKAGHLKERVVAHFSFLVPTKAGRARMDLVALLNNYSWSVWLSDALVFYSALIVALGLAGSGPLIPRIVTAESFQQAYGLIVAWVRNVPMTETFGWVALYSMFWTIPTVALFVIRRSPKVSRAYLATFSSINLRMSTMLCGLESTPFIVFLIAAVFTQGSSLSCPERVTTAGGALAGLMLSVLGGVAGYLRIRSLTLGMKTPTFSRAILATVLAVWGTYSGVQLFLSGRLDLNSPSVLGFAVSVLTLQWLLPDLLWKVLRWVRRRIV